jgi:HSP20 family protein
MTIRYRTIDSVIQDLDDIQHRIATRAVEIFRQRGRAIGSALDDWLQAERETVWRPAIEVRCTKDAFVVTVAAAGVEARQFDLRLTPNEMVLSADLHHTDADKEGDVMVCEFARGPLFRAYRFPQPVDPSSVTAEYRNGLLVVTAKRAMPGTRIDVTAA